MDRQIKKSLRENCQRGQRAREIIRAMDTKNITFEENYVIIRIGNLIKTANKKHHTGEVKFLHFP